MSQDVNKYFEDNKKLWNDRTAIHVKSSFYNNDEFIAGKNSLNKIELEELGDIKGKSILHLQCHFGQDTLSFARMGADVTGVDFSDGAIKIARDMNTQLGLNAEFVDCNIYDLKEHLDKKFDIVFTSYGTIGWLPDLNKWADIVQHFLKPGGFFYIVEFHPFVWMFDDEFKGIEYPYFNIDTPITIETKTTYADTSAKLEGIEHGWNHSLSDILNSLKANGLNTEYIHEFPFSSYNIFPDMYQEADGCWRMKKFGEKIPMMFSIKSFR